MLLIPLLVGIAILTVAVMSRIERLDELHAIQQTRDEIPNGSRGERNPLGEAFPHLRFWVPSDALMSRPAMDGGRLKSQALLGTIGPDIIIGPWAQWSPRQDGSYADAA